MEPRAARRPVSYTHLDVYKRQVLRVRLFILYGPPEAFRINPITACLSERKPSSRQSRTRGLFRWLQSCRVHWQSRWAKRSHILLS